MDPQVALKVILKALRTKDYILAREYAEYLYTWLRRGGFTPRMDDVQIRLVLFEVCKLLIRNNNGT